MTLGRIEKLERSVDEQAKTSQALLQSNMKLITQVPELQTAANTILGRLEQVIAELNATREAVAPGVPTPRRLLIPTGPCGSAKCGMSVLGDRPGNVSAFPRAQSLPPLRNWTQLGRSRHRQHAR